MINWFSRKKYPGGITVTQSSKGVTVSQSSGNKGYRRTFTTKSLGGKSYITVSQKSGGLFSRSRKKWP
jgi:hypothetical protein